MKLPKIHPPDVDLYSNRTILHILEVDFYCNLCTFQICFKSLQHSLTSENLKTVERNDKMEGVGDEVLLFGAATVVAAIMLYYAVMLKFPRILFNVST